jgi:hypothetical protein
MPARWDWLRLKAEAGVAWVGVLDRNVRHLIAASIKSGQTCGIMFRDHVIEATVRADGRDGTTFLALAAEGLYDADVLAVMLDAVPGRAPDDWMEEPDGFTGIKPAFGQLVWSTLLTPDLTTRLLELDDKESST